MMVKHTETVCWLLPTNPLSVFDPFMGLTLKGLNFYFFTNTTKLAPALNKIIFEPTIALTYFTSSIAISRFVSVI